MKKKSAKKTAKSVSAMDILLKNTGQSEAGISALNQQFSSVMSLARADIAQLMEQNPQMHISEARELHAQARAMSVVIARQYREQRLTTSVRQANRPPTGIKGLVEGPTYTDMFNPDWSGQCPPDAIEATTSPVAYLVDLYRYAKELEATGDQDRIIRLDDRRGDLQELMLDHTALNRVEPTIVLVNEILEKSIRRHLDGIGLESKSVDDALLEARYPNTLPYERYTSQINHALGRKDRSLGDVVRAADPAYPYFKEPGVHSLLSDTALIQDTGFGPAQQSLLLEAPYFPELDSEASRWQNTDNWRIDPRTRLMTRAEEGEQPPTTFFQDNFGVGGLIALQDTQTFCLRTGLNTEELEALLSVGAFAPGRSLSTAGEGAVDGSLSGAVYINAGQSPAMLIETAAEGALADEPRHRIAHMTPDRLDRMNRLIRLARWLELPFGEVDQLLVASMQAERQDLVATLRADEDSVVNPWVMTQNTLRALGLFQILRRDHDVPAEDFAALLYGLSVYSRGKTPSQFDRVFNSQALFAIPLILDEQPFTLLPQTDAERQKIDHLCAALGMTFEAYRFVARVVEQTQAGEPLRWSREVVSAFYRLVRLPRYLGLSTIEALALLEMLDGGGNQLVSKLAGVTRIATHYASANTDTLSVIHALIDCNAWLKAHHWTVAQLCKLVLPSLSQPVATDAEQGLLQQMQTRLVSALITDSSFAQAGAPDVQVTQVTGAQGEKVYNAEPIDWFAELNSFIDTGVSEPTRRGLVKYLNGETEQVFEDALSGKIRQVLEDKGLSVEELHPRLTNMIMRARGAQEALLMEGLAGYLNTSADLARALLFWTDGNRYQLLKEVLRVYGVNSSGKVEIGDDVLLVLEALSKRAALATHLGLSSMFIARLIEHPTWFGVVDERLTLQLVYFATQYTAMLRLSEQDESTLLDYFSLINTLWQDATQTEKRLIRDSGASKLAGFLRWGVREVLTVAFDLNGDGVVFTLEDLDTLVRVCLLSRHTGLDAKAVLALYRLTPTSATEDYRQAAERALSCLTEALPGSAEEVGQGVSSAITVSPDYLVANRPDERATYTITLHDLMGEPFEGITVRWACDLGELEQIETTTDATGTSSTVLRSGDKMGIAHVIASFGLGDTLKAPVVTLGCDEASIHFVAGEQAPSEALSNKQEPINFTVTLEDDYGNKATDRTVEWRATLGEFRRYITYTNHLGVAHAELRSRAAGVSHVRVGYRNGQVNEFEPVKFASKPYFQYVRFVEKRLVVGLPATVVCSLVELDGTPIVGEEVYWFNNLIDRPRASCTDEQGVATVQYFPTVAVEVQVDVYAYMGNIEKSTERTRIIEAPVIARHEASSTQYFLGSPDPVVFTVWLEAEGEPASSVAVEWLTDGGNKVISHTDNSGKATFSSKFERGEHQVTATVEGLGRSVTFEVSALPLGTFAVEVIPEDDSFVDSQSPLLLCRAKRYTVLVKLLNEKGESLEGVSFSLNAAGADPTLIGVDIQGLNESKVSKKEGVAFILSSTTSSTPADITLKLVGPALEPWQQTYKLGWIHRPYDVSAGMLLLFAARWSGPGGMIRDQLELGKIVLSVPARNWERSITLVVDLGVLSGYEVVEGNYLQDNDRVIFPRHVLLDGYIILLPGELPIKIYRE